MPTTTAVKTQGSELYYAASSILATKIAQITSAPPPLGGARAQIDITTLDSQEREFAGGLVSPVAETFGLVFNPLDSSHQNLITLKTSGLLVQWWLGLSDGITIPTVIAGESQKSNETTYVASGATSSAVITWTAVTGATGYRIYRGSTSGAEGTYFAVGAVTTYTDTGTAGTAGTLPVANTANLSTPVQSAIAGSGAGGTLAAGTYYWVVTAINSAVGQFVQTPVARSFFYFGGFVQDMVLATPIGDVVKGTVTIQRSGPSVMVPHT